MQNLIKKLTKDFPDLKITSGARFQFSPPCQIFYPQNLKEHTNSQNKLLLLHELGHSLIHLNDYSTDIELLEIEALAWSKAHKLCKKYEVEYDEDFAEDCLDSYRDYLHSSSLCKNCQLSGYQDNSGIYHCPLCGLSWNNQKTPHFD